MRCCASALAPVLTKNRCYNLCKSDITFLSVFSAPKPCFQQQAENKIKKLQKASCDHHYCIQRLSASHVVSPQTGRGFESFKILSAPHFSTNPSKIGPSNDQKWSLLLGDTLQWMKIKLFSHFLLSSGLHISEALPFSTCPQTFPPILLTCPRSQIISTGCHE